MTGWTGPAAAQPDEDDEPIGAPADDDVAADLDDAVDEPAPPKPAPKPPKAPKPTNGGDEPAVASVEPTPAVAGAAGAAGEDAGAEEAAGDSDDEAAEAAAPADKPHYGEFTFGSYGRVMAAGDLRGSPGRNADIVAYGSRLDHSNYVELELRREDQWQSVGADTTIVATMALAHPVFHYNGDFDGSIAIRNLYLEERNLGMDGVSLWAGSRMLRGNDIYFFDVWPLDNLNTIGGGIGYDGEPSDLGYTAVRLHMGLSQPDNPFYRQQAERALPFNQFGTATVDLLDRQKWIGSLRAEQHIKVGEQGGVKFVAYGEGHQIPEGERETAAPGIFEKVPRESGWVVGGQFGAYTGTDATHVNLFVRYATGIAAYGAFAHPDGLSRDETTEGAHELMISTGANWETGPFALGLGAYFRSFRNASEDLDFGDVDEGIVLARPQVWFVDWAGIGVEGSFQAQQRGVLATVSEDVDPRTATDPEPLISRVGRIGAFPFITPAGKGTFSRPIIWLIYTASFRDAGARNLYPVDDVFRQRKIEHFLGIGAEWWFSSTSYAGTRVRSTLTPSMEANP